MCSGRISRKFVERAFNNGAGAVLITGCRLMDKGSDCHYNHANVQTMKRFEKWQKWIERNGIKPERLQLQWVSASEGKVLAKKLEEMEGVLKQVKKTSKSKGKRQIKEGCKSDK
jgi:heterodisulfide reductase subunit A